MSKLYVNYPDKPFKTRVYNWLTIYNPFIPDSIRLRMLNKRTKGKDRFLQICNEGEYLDFVVHGIYKAETDKGCTMSDKSVSVYNHVNERIKTLLNESPES
jgi:hypothetical protein